MQLNCSHRWISYEVCLLFPRFQFLNLVQRPGHHIAHHGIKCSRLVVRVNIFQRFIFIGDHGNGYLRVHPVDALLQQPDDFFGRTAPQVFVTTDNDFIKIARRNGAQLPDIFIPPVASCS